MRIGGVYILSRRSIARMIVALAAAFASLCISASTPDQMLLVSRYANAAQSLMPLKCSLKRDTARTVVPDLLYLEGKTLYLRAKSSGVVPLRVAPAYGTRPVQATAEGFTTADRKMLEKIYRASVYGETPTAAQVVADVRRRQIAYGVNIYKPSSRHVKGVSSYVAAKQAIRQFEDAEGAYSSDEMASLAKAIRREYQKPVNCPRT